MHPICKHALVQDAFVKPDKLPLHGPYSSQTLAAPFLYLHKSRPCLSYRPPSALILLTHTCKSCNERGFFLPPSPHPGDHPCIPWPLWTLWGVLKYFTYYSLNNLQTVRILSSGVIVSLSGRQNVWGQYYKYKGSAPPPSLCCRIKLKDTILHIWSPDISRQFSGNSVASPVLIGFATTWMK